MKKAVSVLILSALLGNTVYAQPVVEDIITNLNDGTVTVKGSDSGCAEADSVNITVINPGYEKGDIVSDKKALQYFTNTHYNAKGEFEVTFKSHLSDNSSGWYKLYVSGDGIDGIIEKQFYFAAKEDMKKRIAEINAAANKTQISEFTQLIKESEDILALKNEVYNAINCEKMCINLMPNVKKDNFDEEDFEAVAERVKLFSLLEAYSESKSVCFKDGEIAYEDLLGISDLDAKYNCTISQIYHNNLSDAGKNAVQKALQGKEYADKDAFIKEFAKLVVLYSIKYPVTGGNGYVENILTKKNADFVGMDISEYLNADNKAKVNTSIISVTASNIGELETKIKTIVSESKNKPEDNNKHSGSGGGTPSISNVINNEKVVEKDIDYIDYMDKDFEFTDIPKGHWAFDSIKKLYEMNVIDGVGNNMFMPDGNVKREQIAKMICTAFGCDVKESQSSFKDVAENAWYYKYVVTAFENGIVKGKSNEYFGVGEDITREDIAVMLWRVLKDKVTPEDNTRVFADGESIHEYAKEAVNALSGMEIINGFSDNTFRPQEKCTRVQASVMIYKCLEKTGGNLK